MLFLFLFVSILSLNCCISIFLFVFFYSLYIFYIVGFNKPTGIFNINLKYLTKSFGLSLSCVFYKLVNLFSCYTVTQIPFKGLKWKPIFKKSSYFGLYRNTKNQYINK